MPLTYHEMKGKIEKRLRRETYSDIDQYYRSNVNPEHLHGLIRSPTFPSQQLCLTLYHDVFDKGYNWLEIETKSWSHITSKTIERNSEYIRSILSEWGSKQINIGDEKEWNKAAEHIPKYKKLQSINLWMHDMDIQVWGKQYIKQKDYYWSYKLNAPGRRYLTICDGNGKIRYLLGGYGPKIIGYQAVELDRKTFENQLKGGVIIADSDYGSKTTDLKGCQIVTPFVHQHNEKLNHKRKRDCDDTIQRFTKKEVEFNKYHKKLHELVKSPYKDLAEVFSILNGPQRVMVTIG